MRRDNDDDRFEEEEEPFSVDPLDGGEVEKAETCVVGSDASATMAATQRSSIRQQIMLYMNIIKKKKRTDDHLLYGSGEPVGCMNLW